jgi:UPF0716 protein FxsA
MRGIAVFLAWTFAEIAVLIVVGGRIGLLATLALLVAAMIGGSAVLRRAGEGSAASLRAAMETGGDPGRALADGAMLAIAGFLLILPGFLSDAVAVALILPPVRRALRSAIGRRARTTGSRTGKHGADVVIDADFVVVEPHGTSAGNPPSGWTKAD